MASQDSSIVSFYKKVFAANTTPDAVRFEDVISPSGSYNTNGIPFGNVTQIEFKEIVEVPKVNGKEGEGTVAAACHWWGDYKEGYDNISSKVNLGSVNHYIVAETSSVHM
ncbi:hypothetical protein H0H92_005316 [Tricholoma furcatifolium]|nr:hypothetical protein H0H92_005316 [Tricholoma furcatifolium]